MDVKKMMTVKAAGAPWDRGGADKFSTYANRHVLFALATEHLKVCASICVRPA
jgi:hypothetical protein